MWTSRRPERNAEMDGFKDSKEDMENILGQENRAVTALQMIENLQTGIQVST